VTVTSVSISAETHKTILSISLRASAYHKQTISLHENLKNIGNKDEITRPPLAGKQAVAMLNNTAFQLFQNRTSSKYTRMSTTVPAKPKPTKTYNNHSGSCPVSN